MVGLYLGWTTIPGSSRMLRDKRRIDLWKATPTWSRMFVWRCMSLNGWSACRTVMVCAFAYWRFLWSLGLENSVLSWEHSCPLSESSDLSGARNLDAHIWHSWHLTLSSKQLSSIRATMGERWGLDYSCALHEQPLARLRYHESVILSSLDCSRRNYGPSAEPISQNSSHSGSS